MTLGEKIRCRHILLKHKDVKKPVDDVRRRPVKRTKDLAEKERTVVHLTKSKSINIYFTRKVLIEIQVQFKIRSKSINVIQIYLIIILVDKVLWVRGCRPEQAGQTSEASVSALSTPTSAS